MSQKEPKHSPLINSVNWGKMEVEGLGTGKDFILWPGGGKDWDWNEHGTGHSKGIQKGDLDELLAKGCRIVVLGRGMFQRIKVDEQTLSYLKDHDVEVLIHETKKGVKKYNELARAGKAVGGLFHTTC